MLFHVTMTHTADNCPGYHPDHMSDFLASMEKLEVVGKELKVKAHSLLWGAPAHIAFAVLESDNIGAIGRYLNAIDLTQEFTITPVQNVSELVEFGKAAMAAKKK